MALDLSLKGLAISRYGSIRTLSTKLGWSYSKTYRIVNGLRLPDTTEVKKLSEALGIANPDDIAVVFSLL